MPDAWSWSIQGGSLVFAPFESRTDYWAADKQFMLNLRVSDLDDLVEDPEANGVELWEPPAA
ncbi:MAG: glyoxalase [Marmoricola sp.]|nr:glyoxalase [Marmoricola sp.]